MPDTNGNQKPADIAHRVGIWVAVAGLWLYMLNIGSWVGAADEKNAARMGLGKGRRSPVVPHSKEKKMLSQRQPNRAAAGNVDEETDRGEKKLPPLKLLGPKS